MILHGQRPQRRALTGSQGNRHLCTWQPAPPAKTHTTFSMVEQRRLSSETRQPSQRVWRTRTFRCGCASSPPPIAGFLIGNFCRRGRLGPQPPAMLAERTSGLARLQVSLGSASAPSAERPGHFWPDYPPIPHPEDDHVCPWDGLLQALG